MEYNQFYYKCDGMAGMLIMNGAAISGKYIHRIAIYIEDLNNYHRVVNAFTGLLDVYSAVFGAERQFRVNYGYCIILRKINISSGADFVSYSVPYCHINIATKSTLL